MFLEAEEEIFGVLGVPGYATDASSRRHVGILLDGLYMVIFQCL